LGLLKKSAFLINTSRGPILDENALYEAINSRKIAGAGLDVLTKEPPDKDNRLLELDSVVFTPHCAALTRESFKRAWMACANAIASVFRGELPEPHMNIVNPEVVSENHYFTFTPESALI